MERERDDLIDRLHDVPVGTEDPNIVNVGGEPRLVVEGDVKPDPIPAPPEGE